MCPEWVADIPTSQEAEFAELARALIEDIKQTARQQIIGLAAVRDWHRTLFERYVPLDYYAGNFRQVTAGMICLERLAWVGGKPASLPESVLSDMLTAFGVMNHFLIQLEISWQRLTPRERALRVSQLIAWVVGRFIQIHPFLNGNGRVSRLIWNYFLDRFGVRHQVRLFPRPGGPYEQLMAPAMGGNFNPLWRAVLTHLARHAPSTN